MQYRHLHYFVSVVDAGSFSRAAETIHVAQPALSQQIAQLEEQLGVSLLLRSARGVRPTAAGDVLYREASSILGRLQNLPGILRSSGDTAEGVVRFGMSSPLLASFAGLFIETCRVRFPKVTLRLAVTDSQTIKSRIEANALDLAVVFEDELVITFSRKPLFRQRLYLVCREPRSKGVTVSLADLKGTPLVLPAAPNITRTVLDRAFATAKVSPNVVMEAELSNILAAVRIGIGDSVLPMGDLTVISGDDLAQPIPIEPPIHLTCSVISSGNFPLTGAGEAVRDLLSELVEQYLRETSAPGVEWIGGKPAIGRRNTRISK
jgi:LysR family nitrogen assimilation transcriptional regulator